MTNFPPPLPRPVLQKLEAYVPGEQPKEQNIIKLNTNEFPYPPALEVIEAVRAEATDALRRYPNPTSQPLREALATVCGVEPKNIFVCNGSDEVLRMLVQAYIDPGEEIAILDPTYSLYPVLATMYEGKLTEHAAGSEGQLPASILAANPRMFMIANPNPPIGTFYTPETLESLAQKKDSLLIVDEAYVAFAPQNCLPLVKNYPNAIITRTFSKSHGMAGMRVGYAVAHEQVIFTLDKIRDSYNVNRVSQAAALAAIGAQDYYGKMCCKIAGTREILRQAMIAMNYDVPASAGNFIFARSGDGRATLEALRQRGILARYFDLPGLRDGVRITIGTDEETSRLIEALKQIPLPKEALR